MYISPKQNGQNIFVFHIKIIYFDLKDIKTGF